MGAVTRTYSWGTDARLLENEMLRCVCLPEHGGKLASLYHKAKNFELLFQNQQSGYRKASPGSAFGDFEACGFDDAFPNIDAGRVRTDSGEVEYFDHGEIWAARFDCEERPDGVVLAYKSPFLGYFYKKSLVLSGNVLSINYLIRNESDAAFPCIWACHCLVNYRRDMRLIFPKGTDSVIAVMATRLLGPAGTVYRFPSDKIPDGWDYDFTTVPEADDKTMLKYYCCGESQEGLCGYLYPTEGISATFHYDAALLPYLGFWITVGGYRGDKNCALEPTNGFYDSIAMAKRNGKCQELRPNEEMRFQFDISLNDL